MDPNEDTPRLGVNDKRRLFYTLMGMVERLFFLNKFPVDMEDFALSMQPPDVEAAWKLLSKDRTKSSVSPCRTHVFTRNNKSWQLHMYPPDSGVGLGYDALIFMDTTNMPDVNIARRHSTIVSNWCGKQDRLEDQMLRSLKVIKAIVHSCNTVGQYKRVSPDLLTFLPGSYKDALRNYTKKSPYPAITVSPEEIDTTLSTLAFAALQPKHKAEDEYLDRAHWRGFSYNLDSFPRSSDYLCEEVRQLNL